MAKAKVRQAVVPGQRLADERQRANIELRARMQIRRSQIRRAAPCGVGRRVAGPAGPPQLAHQLRHAASTEARSLRAGALREMAVGPRVQLLAQAPDARAGRTATRGNCVRARGSVSLETAASASPRMPGRRDGNPPSACRCAWASASASIAASIGMFHSACSIFFVMAWANVGPGGDLAQRVAATLFKHLVRGNQPVEESPRQASSADMRAPGKQQLRSASLADDPRQDRAGTHVAAGQAHAREQKSCLRARRSQAEIRRHREDRAGTGANAVDRRNDRLRAMRAWPSPGRRSFG